jgi:hypothetical protein
MSGTLEGARQIKTRPSNLDPVMNTTAVLAGRTPAIVAPVPTVTVPDDVQRAPQQTVTDVCDVLALSPTFVGWTEVVLAFNGTVFAVECNVHWRCSCHCQGMAGLGTKDGEPPNATASGNLHLHGVSLVRPAASVCSGFHVTDCSGQR